MAVGIAITSEGGQYNGRVTLLLLLSCMMAAIGGIIFGYDLGISGGVTSMEPFLRKFFPKVYTKMKEDTNISNYCKFDGQLLTSFTSSLYIAGLISSFFASPVTRAFGRKPSILIGGAAFLVGSALGAAALNVYMLIFSRVLLGVGVRFAKQVCTQKSNEHWLPMRCRPRIISLDPNYSCTAPPETPNSLIQNNNDPQKAKPCCTAYAAPLMSKLNWMISSKRTRFRKPSNTHLGKSQHENTSHNWTFSQGESAALMSTVVTGLVGTTATFVSMLRIDNYDRGIQMLATQITVGVILAALLGDRGGLNKGAKHCSGSGISLHIHHCTIFSSHALPIRVRDFLLFGAWVALMTPFVYLFLPDTKNVPVKQMGKVWREHWFWKSIVGDENKACTKSP
ncbi:hypothetical protein F3Y22_tig00112988pilonHSYRG00172 [Hibiscus syriacus]|uniref:Hexose carrier protein HEX6 n=1 Tax=Hibiscus syriacus TaxID=106335 RepID=A0A6A2WR03_HIBSY|nr:hypothetical protein F3Y22_tig00112988pilonHSYRG00172 [Hibiscus syriacus]